MEIGTRVTYQRAEHSVHSPGADPNVTFHSAPAIVTAIRQISRLKRGSPVPVTHLPGEPPRNAKGDIMTTAQPAPFGKRPEEPEYEVVEVVSLTVFHEGYISFEKEVEGYRDGLGEPGQVSYRPEGQEPPQYRREDDRRSEPNRLRDESDVRQPQPGPRPHSGLQPTREPSPTRSL